jgi:hypothetical protein
VPLTTDRLPKGSTLTVENLAFVLRERTLEGTVETTFGSAQNDVRRSNIFYPMSSNLARCKA